MSAEKIIGFIALNFISIIIYSVLRGRALKLPNLANVKHSFFRAMPFDSERKSIVIAGMGHPKNNTFDYNFSEEQSIEGVIADLKKRGFSEMISLDDQFEDKVTEGWNDSTHNLYKIFVNDYDRLTFDQSLELLRIVKKASANNKSLVIHCGEGSGRTGSALATIRLMVLIQKKIDNGSLDTTNPSEGGKIYLGRCEQTIKTTYLVQEAIDYVRSLPNSGVSVETVEQVEMLQRVEAYLTENKNQRKGC